MSNGRHTILAVGAFAVALLLLFPGNLNYFLATIIGVAAVLVWWNEGRNDPELQ